MYSSISAKLRVGARDAYLVVQTPDDESVDAEFPLEKQRGILYPVRFRIVTADRPAFLPMHHHRELFIDSQGNWPTYNESRITV